MSDDIKGRYSKDGDQKVHFYKFTGQISMPSGQTLDVTGKELIETEVHWLVRDDKGRDWHVPKNLFSKQEVST